LSINGFMMRQKLDTLENIHINGKKY
jgi:hypothetical protein